VTSEYSTKCEQETQWGKASRLTCFFLLLVCGRRVREASMSALETLTRFVAENDSSLLTPKM